MRQIYPLSVEQATDGVPILPLKRVRVMTDKEFEALVQAWLETLHDRYLDTVLFGGAGGDAQRVSSADVSAATMTKP